RGIDRGKFKAAAKAAATSRGMIRNVGLFAAAAFAAAQFCRDLVFPGQSPGLGCAARLRAPVLGSPGKLSAIPLSPCENCRIPAAAGGYRWLSPKSTGFRRMPPAFAEIHGLSPDAMGFRPTATGFRRMPRAFGQLPRAFAG